MGPSVAAANRQHCILLMTRRLPVVARKEHKFMYNNILLYERVSEGYGRQYGDPPYGGGRSSQEYSCDRSSSGGRSQGRGLMSKPWEGEMVPGSGRVAGQGAAGDGHCSGTSWHMDNLESELPLNILNAVLTNKEKAQWARLGRQTEEEDGLGRPVLWVWLWHPTHPPDAPTLTALAQP
ncbi:hypothetical protein O3P69_019827 [Scylla paramamosain]|uniref:Uncharacterized protein n=1 Tax=Scylla paramamosain TaxID=85552 RepID=A0AAW0SAH4_SCYPA